MCANFPLCAASGIACSMLEPPKETFDYPFEIHLTVKANSDIDSFKEACHRIGTKPVLLDLHGKSQDVVMIDLMTTSKYRGSLVGAKIKALDEKLWLEMSGFEIIRTKIETVPWHPSAKESKDNQYFESHLAVVCPSSRKEELASIAHDHNAHRSRNTFKTIDNDNELIMVTYRSRECIDLFTKNVDNIKTCLEDSGFSVDKVITEFAIYDTKIEHDQTWIAKV